MNGSDSSTVTIEWTPPTALVQYTTTTTPVPEKMGFDAVSIDLLVERTQLLVTELSAMLTELTLQGQVENTAGGFIRVFAEHSKTSR